MSVSNYTYGGTYSGTSSASSTSSNSRWDQVTHHIENISLSSSKKKKEIKIQSKIVQKLISDIGISGGHSVECIHAPKISNSNIYMKDIDALKKRGYVVNLYPFGLDNTNRIEYGCGAVFLINILELLPSLMARALALKECIGFTNNSGHSIIVVSSRTKEELEIEAIDKKYEKKDNGFLIETPGKKPLYAEGIHKDHIADLFKYVNQTKLYDNKSENCVAAVITP